MPRTKSPSGSKTSRTNDNKEQNGANIAPNASDVKAPAPKPQVAAAASQAEVSSAASKPKAEIKTESKPEIKPRPEIKLEPKKPEVVKAESRKNLVPINMEDEIRRRAYELYQQRGMSGGSEAEDWFAAEHEVRQRYRAQSASA